MKKRYSSSEAQRDTQTILGHTCQDIAHVLNDNVSEVLPFQDGIAQIDARLMAMYMQSIHVSRFAAEALHVERILLVNKLQSRLENEDVEERKGKLASASEGSTIRKHTVSSIVDILPLKVSAGESEPEDIHAVESSLKQLKKDIERDKLIVNGKVIIGSEAKLQGCMDFISDVIDSVLLECSLPLLSREGKEILIFCLLRNIARTHSGGATFQALQTAVDIDTTLIVPVSASAQPLRILVSVGSFPIRQSLSSSSTSHVDQDVEWGLKCLVLASTVFILKSIDGNSSMERCASDLDIHAVYDDSFYIPIDSSQRQISKDVVIASLASSCCGGNVTMKLLNRDDS